MLVVDEMKSVCAIFSLPLVLYFWSVIIVGYNNEVALVARFSLQILTFTNRAV